MPLARLAFPTAFMVATLFALPFCPAAEPGAFTRTTIDLGMVVTDVEKSVAFYTDVIGFTDLPGFDVPATLATDAGPRGSPSDCDRDYCRRDRRRDDDHDHDHGHGHDRHRHRHRRCRHDQR